MKSSPSLLFGSSLAQQRHQSLFRGDVPAGCRDEGVGDGSVDNAGQADARRRLLANGSEQVG